MGFVENSDGKVIDGILGCGRIRDRIALHGLNDLCIIDITIAKTDIDDILEMPANGFLDNNGFLRRIDADGGLLR